MTYKEALNQFNSANPFMHGSDKQEEYFNVIGKAIEKQIPTKVMRKGHTIVCPNCNGCLDFPEILNYCYSCGQALDWCDTE